MKRWMAIIGLFIFFIGGTLLGFAWSRSRPRINKENFDRIELGMTKTEVEAIFGHDRMQVFPNSVSRLIVGYTECEWIDDEEMASVIFDERDEVASRRWFGPRRHRETYLEKFSALLPWQPPPPPIPGR